MLGQTPLAWMAPVLGMEELNVSQALYADLHPERPGTLLFWLNRQPHPPASYLSVVRTGGPMGDWLMSPASQDLNRVLALYGRATTIVAGSTHALTPSDGTLLVSLLERLRRL
jgi:hypothetical protein